MLGYAPDSLMLAGWGTLEAIIAVWILSGKKIFLPSVAATVLLCLIVLFNFSSLEVVFRDVAIALTAATLAWWSYPEAREKIS